MSLRNEHPDWIDRWIDGTVISSLMKEKDEAISQNKNYAFETNFSTDLPVNLIRISKMQVIRSASSFSAYPRKKILHLVLSKDTQWAVIM